jgi:hypothetical protein
MDIWGVWEKCEAARTLSFGEGRVRRLLNISSAILVYLCKL